MGESTANAKHIEKSLLVVDSDHFSELERNLAAGQRLALRLSGTTLEKATTVVTIEEQMRGWLAQIGRVRDVHRQVAPYSKLQRQIDAFADWLILPWDQDSADLFTAFRRDGLRIGSLDLKIACIVMAHDATLLTRNSIDFGKVPGLRFENWLLVSLRFTSPNTRSYLPAPLNSVPV